MNQDEYVRPCHSEQNVSPRLSAHARSLAVIPEYAPISIPKVAKKCPQPPPHLLTFSNIKIWVPKKNLFLLYICFHLQLQRNHQGRVFYFLFQLFLSPNACRLPLCALSNPLIFALLLGSWQMPLTLTSWALDYSLASLLGPTKE